MIKWTLLAIVVALAGWFGWGYLHPEKRACQRLAADLCNHGGDVEADRQKCEDMFVKLKEAGGKETAESSARCVAEATSCAGAAGCVAGAAGKVGAGVLGEFLKGAEKAFGK